MKLELKKRVLELSVYGELVEVNFPTLGLFRKYEKRLKDGSDTVAIIQFLGELGLSEEKVTELEPAHLKQVVELLVGGGKK